jgi:REP element-mobilizing transposase RayT
MHSCQMIDCRLHAGSTETTHIHALVSWKHARSWLSIRSSLKTSLTKALKLLDSDAGLSRGCSRKHVKDSGHFANLMKSYLPKHEGVAWYEDRGWVQSRQKK